MKRIVFLLLCVTVLLFKSVAWADLPTIGGGGSGGVTVSGSGQYSGESGEFTLMIYMIGSNLESEYGEASRDIIEIAQSGVNFSTLNVVVAAGGSSAWHELSVGAGEVGFGAIRRDSSTTGIIWDRKENGSISSPRMLSRFLSYVYDNYPAKKYGLIFWNHGGGPLVGFGHDEVTHNMFSLRQLTDALNDSPFYGVDDTTTKRKLEFIGFDACLMGSYEVAIALRPFARYLVASEETEPGSGWDYSFVGDNRLYTGSAGKAICDHYAESLIGQGVPYSLSTIDTALYTLDWVLDSIFMNNITSELMTGLAKAVYESQSFGLVSSNSTYDLYDLLGFIDNICSYWPFTSDQVKSLKSMSEGHVVYNRTNIPGANGISFYFPLFTDPSQIGASDVYDFFPVSQQYRKFINRSKGIASKSSFTLNTFRVYDGKSRLSGIRNADDHDDPLLSYQMTEAEREGLVLAEYVILAKTEDEMFDLIKRGTDITVSDDGLLSVNLDDGLNYVVDENEKKQLITLIERDKTDKGMVYFIPMKLNQAGIERIGSLQYFVSTEKCEVGEFVPYDGTDVPPKRLIPLQAGDELTIQTQRYTPAMDEEGTILPFTSWILSDKTEECSIKVKDLSMPFIMNEPYQSEAYYVQIVGTDAEGNCFCSPLLPIEMKNENSDLEENT